jgi:hypothetical protein
MRLYNLISQCPGSQIRHHGIVSEHTERLSRKVMTELRANNTRVAVCACDFAPDDSELAASDLLLRAVHVCDILAQVEVCRLGGADAF